MARLFDGLSEGALGDIVDRNPMLRFYQIDATRQRLLSELECSNAAAGAGLFALLHRLAAPDHRGILHALNASTGQLMELEPPGEAPVWQGGWTVRFLHGDDFSIRSFREEPFILASEDGRRVEFWIVVRGNLFVLANVAPADAEPDLVQQLSAQGTAYAMARGIEGSRARAPKVILYEVVGFDGGEAWINARCFFQGQAHKSLPGSGAMCLSGFLALTMGEAMRPEALPPETSFHLAHPSGSLSVKVHVVESASGQHVIATEFASDVRLLLLGRAIVPAEAVGS